MGIRNYGEADFATCCRIIDATWDLSGHLAPQPVAAFALRYYVGGSLAASDVAWVVEHEGEVRGFIFGRCGSGPRFANEYSGVSGALRTLWGLVRLPGLGWRAKVGWLRDARAHAANRDRVAPPAEGEVTLFAVDPTARGGGYGRSLMDTFLDRCRAVGTPRVDLETDRSSSFGFYDHYGFERVGTFRSPLNERAFGEPDESFVYQLKLD